MVTEAVMLAGRVRRDVSQKARPLACRESDEGQRGGGQERCGREGKGGRGKAGKGGQRRERKRVARNSIG